MTRTLAAIAGGGILGLALFAIANWAFVKGCPIFDVEHDTVLGF
ncbi:hypothetical protein [Mycolicibacterium fortuitum]|nr:hypothetical protein [Mycolicibacterium fortuitum]